MIKAIRNTFRYSKSLIVLSAAASLFSGVCNALLLVEVSNSVSGGAPLTVGYALRFAALVLLAFGSAIGSQILSAHLTVSFAMKIRIQLSRAVMESPLPALEGLGKHRLVASLTQDAGSVAQAALQLPKLCMNVAIILFCMAYLAYVSLPVFFSVLVLLPLSVLSYVVPEKFAIRYVSLERENWDQLVGHFHRLVDGIKELKLNRPRRAQFFARRLVETSREAQHYGQRGANIYIGITTWSNMLYFVIIGVVMIVLPHYTSVGREALVTCALIVLYLRLPLSGLLETFREFDRATVALRKFRALGLPWESVAPAAPADVPAPPKQWRRIELVEVTHGYSSETSDDRPFVLGPVSLTLTPGRLLFIAGGNGSGKTTLAKLVTGLYAPESGVVRLDGGVVNDENRDDYRQHFSAGFSEFALFEDLLGAEPERLKSEADRYLRLLRLDHKVKVMGDQLSTTQLSSGQRRRLALLHAYLEDRPVYLFDEWAADQDTTFKDIFYTSLLPELRAAGKAAVVVRHDARYYYVADEVIRLENGKVLTAVDAGRPESEQLGVGD